MATEDVEKARIDIERERLEFEKTNARLGRSFFRSNSGFLISAAVSLAAVIVSLSQVWITKITKDKELEIAAIQKRSSLITHLRPCAQDRASMISDNLRYSTAPACAFRGDAALFRSY